MAELYRIEKRFTAVEALEFTNIVANTNIVATNDDFVHVKYEGRYQLDLKAENETLLFSMKGRLQRNIFSIISIFPDEHLGTLTISIPKKLTRVILEHNVGSFRIGGGYVQEVIISGNVGKIQMSRQKVKNISIESQVGITSMLEIEVEQFFVINENVGTIDMNKCLSDRLSIESNVGTVKIVNCKFNLFRSSEQVGTVKVYHSIIEQLQGKKGIGTFKTVDCTIGKNGFQNNMF